MGGRGAGSRMPTLTPGGGGSVGGIWSSGLGFTNYETSRQALGAKGKPLSMSDATLNSNPHYDGTYREFSENCQRAVIAYEARRRGYDVTAQPTYQGDKLPSTAYTNPTTGERQSFWQGAFKGAKSEKIGGGTAKQQQSLVEQKMKSYGEGSRAIMSVRWKNGGGHVLNVEYKNGKVYYNDAQVGGKYKPTELFKAIKPSGTQIVRTDNLRFSERVKKSVTKDKW